MFVDTATQLGIVSVLPAAPTSPIVGDLWFDSGRNTLSTWDGTNWVAVQGGAGSRISIGPIAPAAPTSGDMWLDTSVIGANTIKVYNGATWVAHIITHDAGRY